MEIQETGTVVKVADGKAGVRIRRAPGKDCGGCKACRSTESREFLLWVDADHLHEGDDVTVVVPLPAPWRAIGLVFALPLVALLAGVLIGSAWTGLHDATGLGPEGGAVLLGLAFGLAAALVAVLSERRFTRRHRPRVTEVRHAD